ncbi:hypothetical protein [Nocardia sp. NPDC051570]|uniref:hypothetical protein n=1 Tax=Nocardia sp. NPDC051570 TaxID=3364324 RepID=UPI0037B5F578
MPVVIGTDPHKRSATIEVIDADATILATGRYGTDAAHCGTAFPGPSVGDRGLQTTSVGTWHIG